MFLITCSSLLLYHRGFPENTTFIQRRGRGVSRNLYPVSVSHRYALGKHNDTFWEALGPVKNINRRSTETRRCLQNNALSRPEGKQTLVNDGREGEEGY